MTFKAGLCAVSFAGFLLLFQNCAQNTTPIEMDEVGGLSLASSLKGACSFNGLEIANTEVVKAYLHSQSMTCESEQRLCADGVLDGTYKYASCAVGALTPKDCLFDGKTIPEGQSVMAYSVSCEPELRTCKAGLLSGSSQFSTCRTAKKYCLFDGKTVPHNESVFAFAASSVAGNTDCAMEKRTCSDGLLSGTYASPTCLVGGPKSCELNGEFIPHKGIVAAYMKNLVTSTENCVAQTRTCNDGVLSGSAKFASCTGPATDLPTGSTVQPTCAFGDGVIIDKKSVTAYQAGTVAFGEKCVSQTRTCKSGLLSGTYGFATCAVADPAVCKVGDKTVASGGTIRLFEQTNVPFGEKCKAETRSCTDGKLSGTYTNAACAVTEAKTCMFNNKVIAHGASVKAYKAASAYVCEQQTRKCSDGDLSGSFKIAACSVIKRIDTGGGGGDR